MCYFKIWQTKAIIRNCAMAKQPGHCNLNKQRTVKRGLIKKAKK